MLAEIGDAIELGKREILQDVREGWVPTSVSSFSELHDYRDANGYGGAFEDGAHDCLDSDFWNAVQDGLDQWIKAGGLKEAAFNADVIRAKYTDTPCGRKIRDCELDLGRELCDGEKVDLLLDNFMEIADSEEAREILKTLEVIHV